MHIDVSRICQQAARPLTQTILQLDIANIYGSNTEKSITIRSFHYGHDQVQRAMDSVALTGRRISGHFMVDLWQWVAALGNCYGLLWAVWAVWASDH